jgi:putative transposase
MDEKQERRFRRKAIRLTLRGFSQQEILQRINRGHTWLHKWQTRFAQCGWAGLKSQPRRPQHLTGRYKDRTRRLVVQARLRLRKRKVGLLGPQAIQDELRTAQLLRRVPSVSTIRRILHEKGLIQAPCPSPQGYFPQPAPTLHYVLQAMDWTARYLEGGAKVFAFHTIDLQTRAITQTISTDKTGATVRQHALQVWQTLGLPEGLQMDNDAAFCGGYKAPRVLGDFVRLCLYLGIEPIFIPVHEPKRNGVVERLNGLWSHSFWKRRHFRSVAHVKRAGPEFETWYAQRYHPPALSGLTPSQKAQQAGPLRLTAKEISALPEELPITEGRVHCIRRVDAHGQISLLNEVWKVDKRLAGQYVWATVETHQQRLKIYHWRSAREAVRLVKVFRYEIHQPVAPLLPRFKRRCRRRKMAAMC